MTEGLAERKAARGGYMSAERLDHLERRNRPSKFTKYIDAIFINKPQIWVLNNYILTWKPLKTTFHDTIRVIF